GKVFRKLDLGLARPMHLPVAAITESRKVSNLSRGIRVEPDRHHMMGMEVTSAPPALLAGVVVKHVYPRRLLGRPSGYRLAIRAPPAAPEVAAFTGASAPNRIQMRGRVDEPGRVTPLALVPGSPAAVLLSRRELKPVGTEPLSDR